MKSRERVGIKGYGAYIPFQRLPATEVARVWKGGGSGPNLEKAVASIDEDTVTMAIEASQYAMKMAGIEELGAIFVGTESKPYAVKPTSTIVAQALGQHYTLAADLEFACKAATEAVQVLTGLVGSGMIQNGLAIGVDTAQGRPGDELEYTAASGSAAFVISKFDKDAIASIDCSASFVSDTGDFWRRAQEKYPRHLSRFTGEPAYFFQVEKSVRHLFEQTGLKPSDFTYAVFHQPNPRFPVEVAARLGFTAGPNKKGPFYPPTRNTSAAGSPLGLPPGLAEAQPRGKIFPSRFRSGARSPSLSL